MHNKEKQESIEKARHRAQQKATAFTELFNSPIGKEVLQELKEQFDPPVLATGDDTSTIIRASQRDVVRWIEDVIDRGKRNELEG